MKRTDVENAGPAADVRPQPFKFGVSLAATHSKRPDLPDRLRRDKRTVQNVFTSSPRREHLHRGSRTRNYFS